MCKITRQQLFQSPLHFLAFGFGSGLSAKAPGTIGTLVAVPLVWAMAQLPNPFYLTITLLCVLAGPAICNAAAKTLALDNHSLPDHPAIVWDEIVGMMLAMMFIPLTWLTLLSGFLLFRFFDILKPWPIRYFDRHVHGGIGIMLDDIIAAIVTNIILRILLPYVPF